MSISPSYGGNLRRSRWRFSTAYGLLLAPQVALAGRALGDPSGGVLGGVDQLVQQDGSGRVVVDRIEHVAQQHALPGQESATDVAAPQA